VPRLRRRTGSTPPSATFGQQVDGALKRDGLLLTTSRRSPWKQVLVKRLGAKKLPCACIHEAFLTG
jgi:hypothetical protein